MKNSKKLITTVLLLLLLWVIPIQAFAMESATAEIPFTVNNAPGTVVMEAVGGATLPKQTVYEGVSAGKFELTFSEPGDYCYKIYQKPGTQQGITYDSTVYSVFVSVFVNDNGGIYAVTAVSTADSSQKIEDVKFNNTPVQTTQPGETTNPGASTETTTKKPGKSNVSKGTDKTKDSTKTDSSDRPGTGDDSQLRLWMLIMALSCLGITVSYILYKKNPHEA